MKRYPAGSEAAARAVDVDPSALDDAQDARSALPTAWPELLARWQSLRGQLPQIVELALRRTLSDELALRPDHIRETVQALLSRVEPSLGGLILHVHPEDVVYLEGVSLEGVTIETDRDISRGGCVLCTPHARFDATLHTRLSRVLAALQRPAP